MQIRAFEEGDTDEVVALWRLCGLTRPWNDPHRDIARKLEVQRELFLVGVEEGNGEVIASIMAGYDGHRGWVNYLAVHPDARGAGHGRALMAAARGPAARARLPEGRTCRCAETTRRRWRSTRRSGTTLMTPCRWASG